MAKLEGKVQIIDLAKLRETHPEACQDVEENIQFLVVYIKDLEMEVIGCLEEVVSEVMQLSAEEALIFLLTKIL